MINKQRLPLVYLVQVRDIFSDSKDDLDVLLSQYFGDVHHRRIVLTGQIQNAMHNTQARIYMCNH